MKKLKDKQCFSEPFGAARFRLRSFAAQSSGRKHQKTFINFGPGAHADRGMPESSSGHRPKLIKFFWFFLFTKRTASLPLNLTASSNA
jgi:hypothetical protein